MAKRDTPETPIAQEARGPELVRVQLFHRVAVDGHPLSEWPSDRHKGAVARTTPHGYEIETIKGSLIRAGHTMAIGIYQVPQE